MIRDGHKGMVLQRDGKTYAIAPHLSCGLVTSGLLRKLADAADKYGATLKVTSAERIALVGINPEDVDAIWAELGGKPGYMVGNRVRSVKACPGTHFCKRARQDALGVGLELDQRYIGRQMPGKMKLGVSGCPNQCAETAIKDIGLVGGAHGWLVMVGGNGGTCPRLSRPLLDEEVSTQRAFELVEQIMQFYEKHAHPQERLGETINRLGMPAVKKTLGLL